MGLYVTVSITLHCEFFKVTWCSFSQNINVQSMNFNADGVLNGSHSIVLDGLPLGMFESHALIMTIFGCS